MYKISDEVIKFIEKSMNNCKGKQTAKGKTLVEVKIFQGDTLSKSQSVIAMIPLNYIFRKFIGRYKLITSPENINHLLNIDDIKLPKPNEN